MEDTTIFLTSNSMKFNLDNEINPITLFLNKKVFKHIH